MSVCNPIGKRSLGMFKHKWEDNKRKDIEEVVMKLDLVHDKNYLTALENATLNLRVL